MRNKLATLLAITENLTNSWKQALADNINVFSKSLGFFRGEKRTFITEPDMQEPSGERIDKAVQFTVNDNLKWLEETHSQFIDSLFALEATNASGTVKAELIVEGNSWGFYSSLELLRLKSFLDSGELTKMYSSIPVRDTQERWTLSNNEEYIGKGVYENVALDYKKWTSTKTSMILPDPNVNASSPSYKPMVVEHTVNQLIGNGRFQKFSGEWTLLQRAELLRRKAILGTAVKAALEIANQAEVVPSEMTAKKIFGYLHRNQ